MNRIIELICFCLALLFTCLGIYAPYILWFALAFLFLSRRFWFCALYKRYLLIRINRIDIVNMVIKWNGIYINGKEVYHQNILKKMSVTARELAFWIFENMKHKGAHVVFEIEAAVEHENEYSAYIISPPEIKEKYDSLGKDCRIEKSISIGEKVIYFFY